MNLIDAIKSTFIDISKGLGMLFCAVLSACIGVVVVVKATEKMGVHMMANEGLFDFNNEVVWITYLILILWFVDFFVRPVMDFLIRSYLNLWRKSEVTEDGRHSKANVEEC